MQQQFFLSNVDCNTSSECFHLFDSPNCLIGLFCSSHHDTLSTDPSIGSNQWKTVFNYLCAFFDLWRVSIATKFWMEQHSLNEKEKRFFLSLIMIFPQLFCQNVKRELLTLKRNRVLKFSVQRRLSPINSCLLDDPWNVTNLPEQSRKTFDIEQDWALMLAETKLNVSRRLFMTSKKIFRNWEVGQPTAMAFLFTEMDWKRNCCSYTVHECYVFEFKCLYGIQKGLWMFFSYHASLPLLSLGTGDTIFFSKFFFSFDHKFRSIDGVWADQAPGRPGTLFGSAYREAA